MFKSASVEIRITLFYPKEAFTQDILEEQMRAHGHTLALQ